MKMNDQIKSLLEKVRIGKLSEVEAEQQYLHLVNTEAKKKNEIVVLPTDGIKEYVSFQDQFVYDHRKIECINKIENPECRLFIFLPFGFGNETLSWSWKNSLEKEGNLEIWIMGASEISDWRQLVDYLLEHIEPLCHVPFVVYGHSMGGIIAYETLVELERRYQLSPIIFMPSSVFPPEIFERLKVLPPVYEIDNKMDMRTCRDILEKSQIILPLKSGVKPMSDEAIKCDLDLIKTYSHQHDKPALSCPLLALQANNDVLVKDPVSISLWKNYTKGYFSFQEVEGTHLYFMNPPQSFFRAIKYFLKKEEKMIRVPFQPKTYRLISFETGTEEVHVYPYGINPKGYLIYLQDGKMAAHLWSPLRHSNANQTTPDSSGKDLAAEKMLTYLSYTGDYRENQGVIEHSVHASTDPNFDKDYLFRYYHVDEKKITLTTAPLTMKNFRQSKSSVYSKLVWEEVRDEEKYAGHWIIGSWQLSHYEEDDNHVLGEYPAGQLILTKTGYFSIVGSRQNRNRPRYDNLILASNEELYDAIHTCRSYCGRFELIDENNIFFYIDEGLFPQEAKNVKIKFEHLQRRLEFQWTLDTTDKLKIHCRVAENKDKRSLSERNLSSKIHF